MLDMRQLAAIVALESTGSIAAAARELQWSQPTVTHHLKGLASAIGAPVITSDATGTRLTSAGRTLLPTAATILALARRAEREVSIARGSEGGANPLANTSDPLRIGVIPSVGASVMPALLRDLRSMDAQITVSEAETDRLIAQLASMDLDIVILLGGDSVRGILPPGSLYRPLRRERLLLLVPAGHRLAGQTNVSLRDVNDEPWVLSPSEIDPLDQLLRAEAAQVGVDVAGSVFSDDYAVIQSYVAAGLGLALVPESLVARHRTDLSTAEFESEGFVREIGLAIGPHAPRQLVEPFVERLLHFQKDSQL
jgi:DNA-binding transcriptional LysR family regulator